MFSHGPFIFLRAKKDDNILMTTTMCDFFILFIDGVVNFFIFISQDTKTIIQSLLRITKAAYESALKDFVNDYRDREILYSKWHCVKKLQQIQNEALKGHTVFDRVELPRKEKRTHHCAAVFLVCLLQQITNAKILTFLF